MGSGFGVEGVGFTTPTKLPAPSPARGGRGVPPPRPAPLLSLAQTRDLFLILAQTPVSLFPFDPLPLWLSLSLSLSLLCLSLGGSWVRKQMAGEGRCTHSAPDGVWRHALGRRDHSDARFQRPTPPSRGGVGAANVSCFLPSGCTLPCELWFQPTRKTWWQGR